jgi:hypothetical protein
VSVPSFDVLAVNHFSAVRTRADRLGPLVDIKPEHRAAQRLQRQRPSGAERPPFVVVIVTVSVTNSGGCQYIPAGGR